MAGIDADNRGVSCLGLCHPKYDAAALLSVFRASDSREVIFGWLDNFFTPKAPPSQESTKPALIMRMRKQKFCRIHIINGPGLNNNRVQPHEISYGYNNKTLEEAILRKDAKFLNKFRKRLEVVKSITDQAPAGTLVLAISAWLEHAPIRNQTFEILAEEIIRVFPEAHIVDNPVTGGFYSGGKIRFLKEKHGAKAPKDCDIFDLDGEDMETVDMLEFGLRCANARAVYGWGRKENGNKKEGGWQKPQDRTEFPGTRERNLMRYWIGKTALQETSPAVPRDVKGFVVHNPEDGAKKGFTFKMGDGRNYAVALLPRNIFPNKPSVVRIKYNGKVLDTGKIRGMYTEDGSNRWIIDFTKPVTSLPTNSVIAIDRKHAYVINIPGLNRVD